MNYKDKSSRTHSPARIDEVSEVHISSLKTDFYLQTILLSVLLLMIASKTSVNEINEYRKWLFSSARERMTDTNVSAKICVYGQQDSIFKMAHSHTHDPV